MTTKVNIDEKEGMQIAQKLGVLEEGLPNVRLFNGKTTVGTSILQGIYSHCCISYFDIVTLNTKLFDAIFTGDTTLVEYKKLLKKIKDSLKGTIQCWIESILFPLTKIFQQASKKTIMACM